MKQRKVERSEKLEWEWRENSEYGVGRVGKWGE